jgi:hypothetical protein
MLSTQNAAITAKTITAAQARFISPVSWKFLKSSSDLQKRIFGP